MGFLGFLMGILMGFMGISRVFDGNFEGFMGISRVFDGNFEGFYGDF